nr:alpha/beta hydrolase [uncultured Sphaerochaeta sp.]
MGKRLRKFGKILLWIFAVIAVVLVISSVLHATLFRQRRNAITPYGHLVPVFDGQMHITDLGEGDHTIVLLPGMGVALPSADFGPLQRALAEDYKTLVVEYFGVGFSTITDRARTSEHYVEEIREVLNAAGYEPPYVLIPHSISSVYSEHYASLYPDEVEAIISLDGTSTAYYAETPAFVAALLPIAKVQEFLGLTSLLGPLVTNKSDAMELGYTEKEVDDMLAFAGFSMNDTLLDQIAHATEFIRETMDLPYPKEVPFFKVIAKDTYEKPNPQIPLSPKEYQEQHLERIGAQAQFEVLEGNHFIYQSNAEAIAAIVEKVLADL